MNYTVYSKLNGKILRTGYCAPNDLLLQKQENEEVVEGYFSDAQYYWDNGFKMLPEKPGDFYNFDYESKSWVLDVLLISNTNKAKRNELLKLSDWTQLNDVSLSQLEKENWAIYRKKLRDMTEEDFLNNNFPIKT